MAAQVFDGPWRRNHPSRISNPPKSSFKKPSQDFGLRHRQDPQSELGALFYPVYLRGQAYLALHHGAAANLAGLAPLELAHAYQLQGNTTHARTADETFFNNWKVADPDIPILKPARSEYVKI